MSVEWDLSRERTFIENLLSTRLNFLLVFFSIFTAAAAGIKETPTLRALVLSAAAIIAGCLALATWRTHRKLQHVLKLLFAEQPTHPAAVTEHLPTGRHIIGEWAPSICFIILAGWATYTWLTIAFTCLPKIN